MMIIIPKKDFPPGKLSSEQNLISKNRLNRKCKIMPCIQCHCYSPDSDLKQSKSWFYIHVPTSWARQISRRVYLEAVRRHVALCTTAHAHFLMLVQYNPRPLSNARSVQQPLPLRRNQYATACQVKYYKAQP